MKISRLVSILEANRKTNLKSTLSQILKVEVHQKLWEKLSLHEKL